MPVPRPRSSFWDQECNCHVKVEEEGQPRLLGSTSTTPRKPLLPEKSQPPVQIPSITPSQAPAPLHSKSSSGTSGTPPPPPQSTPQLLLAGKGHKEPKQGAREQPRYQSTPQHPGTTLRDCKTEKPAQLGRHDVGRSPLQEATPSSSVPSFTLTHGSASTQSQGTQLGQPWPHARPSVSPLTAQFPALRQRGKQEHPQEFGKCLGSIRGTR